MLIEPTAERTWVPLTDRERRVAGVLVEKQKTTPENYPMSINAIVTACNQKSARDPITNYDADDVEETLDSLRKKGAAVLVEGSGRVVRYKHTLYDWLGLRNKPVEMAIVAELLLRGPQTEGDLRSRAARMEPIPDLAALQTMLGELVGRGLVIYLSPPGQKRGVIVTHGLYPPGELERVRSAQAQSAPATDEAPRSTSTRSDELATLRSEVESLRAEVRSLAAEVQTLKAALGA